MLGRVESSRCSGTARANRSVALVSRDAATHRDRDGMGRPRHAAPYRRQALGLVHRRQHHPRPRRQELQGDLVSGALAAGLEACEVVDRHAAVERAARGAVVRDAAAGRHLHRGWRVRDDPARRKDDQIERARDARGGEDGGGLEPSARSLRVAPPAGWKFLQDRA